MYNKSLSSKLEHVLFSIDSFRTDLFLTYAVSIIASITTRLYSEFAIQKPLGSNADRIATDHQ